MIVKYTAIATVTNKVNSLTRLYLTTRTNVLFEAGFFITSGAGSD
jgi:hypothetical protein